MPSWHHWAYFVEELIFSSEAIYDYLKLTDRLRYWKTGPRADAAAGITDAGISIRYSHAYHYAIDLAHDAL